MYTHTYSMSELLRSQNVPTITGPQTFIQKGFNPPSSWDHFRTL